MGGAPVRWSRRDTWSALAVVVVTLTVLVGFPLVLVVLRFGSTTAGD